MSDVSNRPNVHQSKSRVRRSLNPDELGLIGANQILHMQLYAGREGHMDTVGRGHLGEVSVSSAINIGDRDDMGTRGKRLQNVGSGSGARGECKSVTGVFQSCDSLFEVIPG